MSGSFDLVVQELSRPSNVHTISVRWYTSIKDIKDQLKKVFNAPPSRINLFHSSIPKALKNSIRLHDLGIEKEGHILKVSVGLFSAKSFILFPSKDIEVDQNCKDMIAEARQGLERSQVPGKTDEFDCTGGVYFLKAASGEKVAVFKPNDEEQGMPNNPKGHAGDGVEGLRPFFQPGQGYIRETAAYLMDVNNFCRVPPTTIVHCEHRVFHYPKVQGEANEIFPKVGSLQSFVYASDLYEDISTSLISTFELQKIAILDMRLLNCDRNSANILAQRHAPNYYNRCRRDSRSSSMGSFPDESNGSGSSDDVLEFTSDEFCDAGCGSGSGSAPHERFELIPIDHGYCIPSKLRIDELDWTWFYAPQISCEVDPEIKRYLSSLNIDELMRTLSETLKIPEYNLFLLRMAHLLLVEAVQKGFTLYQVACLIARTVEDEPSFLEKVVKAAEENAYRTIEMKSNRLNSRGSRSASMGSRSGSFHSPTRIRPFPSANSISRDASDSVYEGGSTTEESNGSGGSVSTSWSNVDLGVYGHGRLKKFIEETPDFSSGGVATKKHRVIHSAVNLEALGWSHTSSINGQTAGGGERSVASSAESTEGNKYLAFAASLQQQQKKTHSPMSLQQPQAQRSTATSTLSVENVERLSSRIGSSNNSINNNNNEGDDFYLAELSPHDPCDKEQQQQQQQQQEEEECAEDVGMDLGEVSALSSPEDTCTSSGKQKHPTACEDEEGIALGLLPEGGARALAGSKLVIMHSVDSGATAARLNNPRSFGSRSNGLSAKPVPNSRFSCGRLDEEDSSECSSSFKSTTNHSNSSSAKINNRTASASPAATTTTTSAQNREVSAPIVIPMQGISPESDTTSCEASSKESEGSSPRSFGDNFFLFTESLLNRTNVPFGRSNAVEYVGLVHNTVGGGSAFAAASGSSGKERPFPPRITPPSSQTALDTTASLGVAARKVNKTSGGGSSSSSSGAFSNNSNGTSSGSDEDPETDIETQEQRRGGGGTSGGSGTKNGALVMPRDTSHASLKGSVAGGNSRLHGNTGSITPVSLQRVASFNAFESPAIYEDKTHRQMKSLHREQRKAVAMTPEFMELRLAFAKQAVDNYISKETSSSSKSKTKW